jgi:hypothetical protein
MREKLVRAALAVGLMACALGAGAGVAQAAQGVTIDVLSNRPLPTR